MQRTMTLNAYRMLSKFTFNLLSRLKAGIGVPLGTGEPPLVLAVGERLSARRDIH